MLEVMGHFFYVSAKVFFNLSSEILNNGRRCGNHGEKLAKYAEIAEHNEEKICKKAEIGDDNLTKMTEITKNKKNQI